MSFNGYFKITAKALKLLIRHLEFENVTNFVNNFIKEDFACLRDFQLKFVLISIFQINEKFK